MANIYVNYQGFGFLMSDTLFTLSIILLYEKMVEEHLSPAAAEFVDNIKDQAAGDFQEATDIQMNKYLANPEVKRLFRKILNEVIDEIKDRVDGIRVGELMIKVGGPSGPDYEVFNSATIPYANLTKALVHLRKLVLGELDTTIKDAFQFFP